MPHLLDRRTFLRGAAAGAGALAVMGPSALAQARPRDAVSGALFSQGVSSGQPAPGAITLWTRLEGVERRARVMLEVARDSGFRSVVLRRSLLTVPEDDHTVRLRLAGGPIRPGEQYFYRFSTADQDSPVGRFRTARPADSREPVRIAFFSCQEYIAGYYSAHADLAARDDVDLVVCLGDYVYEQAFASTGSPLAPVRTDATAPDGETQTLAEYRRKYALYHSDPDLLAVRAQHPLAAIWDDHEVEDNYADGIPGGATRNRRVPFAERKANGYRAFYEAMPRIPGSQRDRIYGSIALGGAEVFLLDTRQYRDDQPCNPTDAAFAQPCTPEETGDPSRTLLGAAQKRWLKDGLAASRAPWKIVANQVMIMSLDTAPGIPLNTDSWDGYAAERREIAEHLIARRIRDVAFVTGDIHTFFAGNVTPTGRQTIRGERGVLGNPSVATEFVGSAITSPGIVDRAANTEAERRAAAVPADAAVLGTNPQIAYSNQAYKGYGLLEAGPQELLVEFRAVREHRQPNSAVFTLRRFRVGRGDPYVQDLGGPLL